MNESKWAKLWRQDPIPFFLLVLFIICSILSSLIDLVKLARFVSTIADIGVLFIGSFLLAKYHRIKDNVKTVKFAWKIVLVFSIVIWALGLTNTVELFYNNRNFVAWQIVLLSGFIFGYYNPEVSKWWFTKLSSRVRRVIITLIFGAIVADIALIIFLQSKLLFFAFYSTLSLGPLILLLSYGLIAFSYHGMKTIFVTFYNK